MSCSASLASLNVSKAFDENLDPVFTLDWLFADLLAPPPGPEGPGNSFLIFGGFWGPERPVSGAKRTHKARKSHEQHQRIF